MDGFAWALRQKLLLIIPSLWRERERERDMGNHRRLLWQDRGIRVLCEMGR